MDRGIAASSESTPKVSHGRGKMSCRCRTIAAFPALDPPLTTIT